MSSVASTNPGLADLLNIISNTASPAVSSLLASSKVQSALQNASPSDLVQLSDQALQQQVVDGLFGDPATSQTNGLFGTTSTTSPSTTLASILADLNPADLNPSAPGSATAATAASPAPSLASQLAIYQGQLQAEDTQALFGSTAGAPGASVNVLG